MRNSGSLLRNRSNLRHNKVTFVELFFDLVFVFAITQLSHYLIEHFTVVGGVQTLLVLVAVWWVWISTTWVTNWLHPDMLPVRVLLLALMLPGLIGASAIPEAFDGRALAVALAYLSIQMGRTLFFLWAAKGQMKAARNFQRMLAWLLAGGVFWVAGAEAAPAARMWWWGIALAVECLAPWLGYWVPGLGRSLTTDWEIKGGYMAERCGLFIIIALGESILVTGSTFSGLAWSLGNVLTLGVSLAGSIAMWWLYFDTTAEIGLHALSKSDDPGRLARLSYTYVHLLLVAGIILGAVADEFVVRRPFGQADAHAAVAVLGSAALYLLGIVLFLWAVTGQIPLTAVAGLSVTVALGALSAYLPPVALMAAAVAVMFATAFSESHVRRHHEFELSPVV